MPENALIPQILAIDAGGTMTDTFLIDQDGNFVVGKAQTTPHDESIGFIQSAKDALNYWDLGLDASFPHLKTGIYSGTAMLNRLLERKGREVGVIVSGGMEDYLRTERAIQTYLGYPFSDRLHVITHHHNEPLVPRERILGVRGRIDLFGREIIPLYEGDVRDAVSRLIDHDVASIVVCLLFSYKNKDHERRVREIGQEVMAERGVVEKPIYLSSELYPRARTSRASTRPSWRPTRRSPRARRCRWSRRSAGRRAASSSFGSWRATAAPSRSTRGSSRGP